MTIHGNILAHPDYRDWGAPALVGYLCAMVADRFARNEAARTNQEVPDHGTAIWYR